MFKSCEQKVYNLSIDRQVLNNLMSPTKKLFKSSNFLNLFNTFFEQLILSKNQISDTISSTLSTPLIIRNIR